MVTAVQKIRLVIISNLLVILVLVLVIVVQKICKKKRIDGEIARRFKEIRCSICQVFGSLRD
jgi:hypothetical protein